MPNGVTILSERIYEPANIGIPIMIERISASYCISPTLKHTHAADPQNRIYSNKVEVSERALLLKYHAKSAPFKVSKSIFTIFMLLEYTVYIQFYTQ